MDCDLGEGKAAFLVRSRSEKEIVLGYDDKLFDVRISFLMDEKQQPQLMADTRQRYVPVFFHLRDIRLIHSLLAVRTTRLLRSQLSCTSKDCSARW